MRLRFIFSFYLLLSSLVSTVAQSRHEAVWGKISKNELEMTAYAPDTSADAVVLLDNGFMSVKSVYNELKCVMNAYRRVKILKKSAFNGFGEQVIKVRYFEKLVSVRAQTINPDGTKNPVTEFFEEKLNRATKQKRFSFPNLKEGSIIEFEYTKESANLFSLYPWLFQSSIPVKHSELVLDLPDYWTYLSIYNGQKALKLDSIVEKIDIKPYKSTFYRYSLDTVEAMKPEKYVTTMSDYITYIQFQRSDAMSAQDMKDSVKAFNNWKNYAERLLDDSDLGLPLSYKPQYNDVWNAVKPLLENAKTDEEKMRIVYTFINKNVAWIEDNYDIFIEDKTLDAAYKKKRANSGELNMMLIDCLKEAGIKAKPVLISTRENGRADKGYPVIGQFNHLLCYVENGDNPLFLDAGDVCRPMHLLRKQSLSGSGWVLDKKKPHWVDIPTPYASETMLANLDLMEDGTLKGTIASNYLGYAAVDERTSLKDDAKNEKLKKSWAKTFPDVQLDSIVVVNKDSLYLPFKRTMYCTIPNAATIANDMMYIKPSLKTDFDENPFKQEKRNYPVDLPYPVRDHFVLNMTIPEGYVVEEVPKEVTIGLPNGGGKFIYSCTKKENTIQLMVRVEVKQLHFEVEEYANIKTFFNQIVAKKEEMIVLKKQK